MFTNHAIALGLRLLLQVLPAQSRLLHQKNHDGGLQSSQCIGTPTWIPWEALDHWRYKCFIVFSIQQINNSSLDDLTHETFDEYFRCFHNS